MSKKSVHLMRLLILATLLLLVSCGLPEATEPATTEAPTEAATEAPTEAATEAPTEAATEATPEEIPVFEIEAGQGMSWWDGSIFVYVPAGEYLMGDAEAIEGDNIPAHVVSLDGFWIHRAEVTNRMYAQCVAAGVCQAPNLTGATVDHYNNLNFSSHPVVNVDWENARSYCEWIGGALPSEAQWEWAARGETGEPYYPWGEEEPNCSRLNYAECITPTFTTPVNNYFFGLSPFFLSDMAGNVFEWVNDWYDDGYYSVSPTANPTGPDNGEERVIRSSSFRSPLEEVPVNTRFFLDPEETRDDLGFRCILTGETLATPPPPACTILSYVPIPRDPKEPIQDEVIPPAFDLDVYCNLDNNNNQYGSAAILFEPGTDVNNVTISSPQGTLNCIQDNNNPLLFHCTGSALQPGGVVTVDACYPPVPVQPFPDPTCPVYYHLNPNTGMCEYGVPIPAVCPPPNVLIFGYGCLPPPVNGDCPAGSYAGTYNNQPVCIPAGGPTCQGQNCPATCPEGLVFNEEEFCCEYPPDVLPVCPDGFTYYQHVAACLPDQQNQPNGCTSITTVLPTCAPQDEPGDPGQPGPTGCLVQPAVGGPLVCEFPCATFPNLGACTP